jgi:hypothetical protein
VQRGETLTLKWEALAGSPSYFLDDWGVTTCKPMVKTCRLPVDGYVGKRITAVFAQSGEVTVDVDGSGVVTADHGRLQLSCEPKCVAEYGAFGTTARLRSSRGDVTWAGCTPERDRRFCDYLLKPGRHLVTATFPVLPGSLTVRHSGGPEGTVTSDPSGIVCGADCYEEYPAGTVVKLFTDYDVEWSGCESQTSRTCTVTITEKGAADVDARFPTGSTIRLTRTGDYGTITSSPSGINCGPSEPHCSADFPPGTWVTLSASHQPAWSGDECAGAGTTCTFQIRYGISYIWADFTDRTPPAIDITVTTKGRNWADLLTTAYDPETPVSSITLHVSGRYTVKYCDWDEDGHPHCSAPISEPIEGRDVAVGASPLTYHLNACNFGACTLSQYEQVLSADFTITARASSRGGQGQDTIQVHFTNP